MSELTSLEYAAIEAILGKPFATGERPLDAVVLSRTNTGGGFLTDLKIVSGAENWRWTAASPEKDVWIAVAGLKYGLGMLLHSKDDGAVLLEGYAVGPEDTAAIDFERVRFTIAEKPGPFAANDI